MSQAPTGTSGPSVGHRTAVGFVWMLIRTVAVRGVQLGGQVALAYLLNKEDWGVVALAYTVTAVTSRVQDPGLRQVLVQRQRRFAHWANPAFWLSMACGVGATVATLAAAPLAAAFYGQPIVFNLLLILAINPIVMNLGTVPLAQLQSQLRFKAISVIEVISATINVGLAGFAVGLHARQKFAITNAMQMRATVLPPGRSPYCELAWRP